MKSDGERTPNIARTTGEFQAWYLSRPIHRHIAAVSPSSAAAPAAAAVLQGVYNKYNRNGKNQGGASLSSPSMPHFADPRRYKFAITGNAHAKAKGHRIKTCRASTSAARVGGKKAERDALLNERRLPHHPNQSTPT